VFILTIDEYIDSINIFLKMIDEKNIRVEFDDYHETHNIMVRFERNIWTGVSWFWEECEKIHVHFNNKLDYQKTYHFERKCFYNVEGVKEYIDQKVFPYIFKKLEEENEKSVNFR
jgi:hypothetical protein